MPKVLDMPARAYEHRRKYSEIAAFWRMGFELLNRIIHIWPYESLETRAEARDRASAPRRW